MPDTAQPQLAFAGVDAVSAPHLVSNQNAQTATNIDFGMELGAAFVRRGSLLFQPAIVNAPIAQISRNFNSAASLDVAAWYVVAGNAVYRGVSGSYTAIATPLGQECAGNSYQKFFLVPGVGVITTSTVLATLTGGRLGTSTTTSIFVGHSAGPVKDDGATTTDWVLQAPGGQPSVTINTLTPLPVTATWTPSEGGLTVSTATVVTTTGTTTSTSTTTTTATGAYSPDPITFRLELDSLPIVTGTITGSDLSFNGTNAIGDYGVDCLNISFSDPSQVTRISRDYSIGDTSFKNYWHTEFTDGSSPSAFPDAAVLIESVLTTATYTDATTGGAPTRDDMAAATRNANRPTITQLSHAANSFNLWAVPRTKFDLVNSAAATPGWSNIQAMRVIVECASTDISVKVANWQILGAENYSLSDPQVGYTYFYTWATLDTNGGIMAESAPSLPSITTPIQNGQFTVEMTNTYTNGVNANGSVANGITHALLYRNGGYLNDIYCVGSSPTNVTTSTITDSLSDMAVLGVGRIMTRNILSNAAFNALGVTIVSEPFYSRVFCSANNVLYWSKPSQPDIFPYTSYSQISHTGDNIRGLVPWGARMVIVNRDSVYELQGSIFEGANANWSLARMGCRHGSKSRNVIMKTPYGIPLLDYEGLFMYQPGQGVDKSLPWVQAQIGDAWQGPGTNQIVALKGNRVPAINNGGIDNACACWSNDKLYLAVCTGTNVGAPDTLFVLNFLTEQCQWFQYPWGITALYWDAELNRVIAGLPSGQLMQLELNTVDNDVSGTQLPISWSMKSRAWSASSDSRLENIGLDIATPVVGTAVVSASYDGSAAVVLGTTANAGREWVQFPQGATISRDVSFSLSGTQGVAAGAQTVIYQMKWTAIAEPDRVQFTRSDDDKQGQNAENLWTAQYSDLEIIKTSTSTATGTVLAVTYIDSVAVMTNSFVGPSLRGSLNRQVLSRSFPWQTYGNLGYVTYTVVGAADCVFKHWGTEFVSTPEPDRFAFVAPGATTYPSPNFMKTWVVELNPNGTCTGDLYMDDVKVLTETFTGTTRQVFNVGLDLDGAAFRVCSKVEPTYTAIGAGSTLKHYSSNFETEAKPYSKTSWAVTYKKSGGATQLDMARFWSLDAEVTTGTAIVTASWDIDGVAFSTNALVLSGRSWTDRIAFPPGGRGYLFNLRLTSTVPIEVYKSNLDIEMIGVKGFSRRTYAGTPVANA